MRTTIGTSPCKNTPRFKGRGVYLFEAMFCLLSLLYPLGSLFSQWVPILHTPDEIRTIYFLDKIGFPAVGFAGAYPNLKTTDGGKSWIPMTGNEVTAVLDFAFKDSLTGWAVGDNGCVKTTDGGYTWRAVFPVALCFGTGIYFNSKVDRLLFSTWSGSGLNISTDEGSSWSSIVTNDVGNGISFSDDDHGLISTAYTAYASLTPSKWLASSDGGYSWHSTPMDTECWQTLAISNTRTFFAISDITGTVSRSDDGGLTWADVYHFDTPINRIDNDHRSSGSIQGDIKHLFVQLSTGCYMSTDAGVSWISLCGPATSLHLYDRRFYVEYPRLFVATSDAYNQSTLWELNIDSMHYFRAGLSFDDSSRLATVRAGDAVHAVLTSNASQIGTDSGHIVLRYDLRSLSFKDLKLPVDWVILDSSSKPGLLDLHIKADPNAPLPNPIATFTFNTYAADSFGYIVLDSAHLYGKRLNCDCQALSITNPDSLVVKFSGCGDATLADFMQGRAFEIFSIAPNPSRNGFNLVLDDRLHSGVRYELLDELGDRRGEGTAQSGESRIETAGLPSGVYYLRLSESGYVTTRRVVVRH